MASMFSQRLSRSPKVRSYVGQKREHARHPAFPELSAQQQGMKPALRPVTIS